MIGFNDICDPKWYLKCLEELFTEVVDIPPIFELFLFCSPLQFPTLAQDCLLNEGHTGTPDFPVLAWSSCLYHEKICHASIVVLLFLLSLNSWWL